MNAKSLAKLDFELAYLSALTLKGLKPLSRWEKKFDPTTEETLQSLGLKTRVVTRSVQSGQRLRELLFSSSDECLGLYASRFAGRPIDRSRDNLRIEGLLFGYPSCCVESYAARGYTTNALRRRDQRILFHWACPRCAITPLLLPQYRRIYRTCRSAKRGRVLSLLTPPPDAAVAAHLHRAVAIAASVVALGAWPMPALSGNSTPDPHMITLPVADDPDADFLTTGEETILAMNPHVCDENTNAVLDGVDLAGEVSAAIEALPTTPSATEPYVVHHPMFGLEDCLICGRQVDMGFLNVRNPLENQTHDVPYIAQHFLEHGSFSYSGSLHSGRINPTLLKLLVTSRGQGHFIAEPAGTDPDNDGLRQWEEPDLGTDPQQADTDGDRLPDGTDLARELRGALDALPRTPQPDRPYVREHMMWGSETCPRCGESWVMGSWEVINPVTGDSITVPTMALHYLEHGAFGWRGGQLFGGEGRIDPRHLQAILTSTVNRHLLPVSPDHDGDLLSDSEEQAIGKNPAVPDEDGNVVRDGLDLARATAAAIAALPTQTNSTQVHRLDFPLLGLERCDTCGINVNMGHLTICNPCAQLYAELPYIGLHYLEHDSFSFAGGVHGTGRTDVKLLLDALHSTGPTHLLPVPGDTDADGLNDHEERHFGTDPAQADTDQDGMPDGFELARGMWREVESLPRLTSTVATIPTGRCYAVDHLLYGMVACPVCGTSVNMGWVEVVNPNEQQKLNLPYLALHFMAHGSFAYGHQDRINPCLLDVILHGQGTAHLIPVSGDSDGDGLLDGEESPFRTLPGNPDSDGNGVADGVQLARRMYAQVAALPTATGTGNVCVVHHPANCVSPCPVCGEEFNCGHVEVTNAWTGLSLRISYMNLHCLERGSFAVSATERVDPLRLEAILRPAVVIAAGESKVTLRWPTQSGHRYQIFTAPDLSGPWTPGPVLVGDGTELSFSEEKAAGAARKFYKIVAGTL